MSVPECKADPQVGGRFDSVMRAGDQDMPHGGVYKELNPFSRIVFSWESPFSADESEVTILLEENAGKTSIQLTHIRFLSEESRDNHEKGWTAILACLEKVAA